MSGNSRADFCWLRTGDEAFAQMLAAIDASGRSVRLEMYIFTADGIGQAFRAALVRARQRGARVQVLIDAFGSFSLPENFWVPLVQAGGEFRWFNRLRLERWSHRDHRKLLVCDETTAFVGGLNIAEDFAGDGVTRGWRDLELMLTGALTGDLAASFDAQFAAAGAAPKTFSRLRPASGSRCISTPDGDLLLSGPGRGGANPIKRALVADLRRARSVRIITPYFLPTWRIRRELRRVTQRGGRAQLILAGKSDVPLARLASQRLYHGFLSAGVEIYEYQPQILHAKLFLIDHVVYTGSANLDTRSLTINHELLVRLPDEKLAYEASRIFQEDLEYCQKVEADAWTSSRSFWQRWKERWAYFILARVDPYFARRQLPRA
ncbi:MAG: phosphatidylserine/phosphatidylglycerophosphate/cardiolipin synthase family protein [Verrucomicrobia bacterium]|nr:phosphatidylserine/phosphatidylglycerophosphate/cardiolipin synthase family protein [Verrucomicrobiota bacterium]